MDMTFPTFVRASSELAAEAAAKKLIIQSSDNNNNSNSTNKSSEEAPLKSLLELVIEANGRLGLVPQRAAPKRAPLRQVITAGHLSDEEEDKEKEDEEDEDDEKTKEAQMAVLTTRTSWTPPVYLLNYFFTPAIVQAYMALQGITCSLASTQRPSSSSSLSFPPPLLCLRDVRLPAEVEQRLRATRMRGQSSRERRNIYTTPPGVLPQQAARSSLSAVAEAAGDADAEVDIEQLKQLVFASSPIVHSTSTTTAHHTEGMTNTMYGDEDHEEDEVVLRGLQSCALSSLLLGNHVLLCGPAHSGKRTTCTLALGSLLLAQEKSNSPNKEEERHGEAKDEQKSQEDATAQSAPRALCVFASFAELIACGHWLSDAFGPDAFRFLVFAKDSTALEPLELRHSQGRTINNYSNNNTNKGGGFVAGVNTAYVQPSPPLSQQQPAAAEVAAPASTLPPVFTEDVNSTNDIVPCATPPVSVESLMELVMSGAAPLPHTEPAAEPADIAQPATAGTKAEREAERNVSAVSHKRRRSRSRDSWRHNSNSDSRRRSRSHKHRRHSQRSRSVSRHAHKHRHTHRHTHHHTTTTTSSHTHKHHRHDTSREAYTHRRSRSRRRRSHTSHHHHSHSHSHSHRRRRHTSRSEDDHHHYRRHTSSTHDTRERRSHTREEEEGKKMMSKAKQPAEGREKETTKKEEEGVVQDAVLTSHESTTEEQQSPSLPPVQNTTQVVGVQSAPVLPETQVEPAANTVINTVINTQTTHTITTHTIYSLPRVPTPVLLCTLQSLEAALELVDGAASDLPLEEVRVVYFSHLERALRPPYKSGIPNTYWLALSTAVDVECQYLFTASRLYHEVHEFVLNTLIPDTRESFVMWTQRDETLWTQYATFDVATVRVTRQARLRQGTSAAQDSAGAVQASTPTSNNMSSTRGGGGSSYTNSRWQSESAGTAGAEDRVTGEDVDMAKLQFLARVILEHKAQCDTNSPYHHHHFNSNTIETMTKDKVAAEGNDLVVVVCTTRREQQLIMSHLSRLMQELAQQEQRNEEEEEEEGARESSAGCVRKKAWRVSDATEDYERAGNADVFVAAEVQLSDARWQRLVDGVTRRRHAFLVHHQQQQSQSTRGRERGGRGGQPQQDQPQSVYLNKPRSTTAARNARRQHISLVLHFSVPRDVLQDGGGGGGGGAVGADGSDMLAEVLEWRTRALIDANDELSALGDEECKSHDEDGASTHHTMPSAEAGQRRLRTVLLMTEHQMKGRPGQHVAKFAERVDALLSA